MTTKSKLKEPIGTDTKADKPKPIIDFMEKWAKEEKCYKDAKVYDFITKKFVEDGGLRWFQKSTEQFAYERWLSDVVNQATGTFYQQRDEDGIPIKGTGARHVISVIMRVRDAKGAEYLLSKGKLIGYDAGGMRKEYSIARSEKWRNTVFLYRKNFNEKTGVVTVQTEGPSPADSHDVYEMPFNAENVRKLYEKVEESNCQFVVKDMITGEAVDVPSREDRRDPGSIKERLDLFTNKTFDYLFKAQQLPAPVKMEHRMEAVAQGIIKGVGSDYQMQSQSSSGSAGVE